MFGMWPMATKNPSTSWSQTSAVLRLRRRTPRHQVLRDVVDLFHHGVGQEFQLGVLARAVDHDLRGAELLAPMHQRHLAAEAREEVGFLHGGVSAADHHDLPAAIKEAVAGGAGTHAVPDQFLFGRQVQPARRGARGDYQGCAPRSSRLPRSGGRDAWRDRRPARGAVQVARRRSSGACFFMFSTRSGPLMPLREPGEILPPAWSAKAARRRRGRGPRGA